MIRFKTGVLTGTYLAKAIEEGSFVPIKEAGAKRELGKLQKQFEENIRLSDTGLRVYGDIKLVNIGRKKSIFEL